MSKSPRLTELATRQPTVVLDGPAPAAKPGKRKRKVPTSPPHVSVYISRAVMKEFHRLAIDTDQRVHDLYLRGFDLVLRENGRPSVDEIDQKN